MSFWTATDTDVSSMLAFRRNDALSFANELTLLGGRWELKKNNYKLFSILYLYLSNAINVIQTVQLKCVK